MRPHIILGVRKVLGSCESCFALEMSAEIMAASSRGYQAAASLIRSSRQCTQMCPKYITLIRPQTRCYAVAAAEIRTNDPSPPPSDPKITSLPPVTSTSRSTKATTPYIIKSGILLSRAPILTREPHAFEDAYFLYQKRLNERLALPFTRYFYYKKDTPADNDWKMKAKERNGAAARDVGGYAAYSDEGWNDEALVGDKTSSRETMVEKLLQDNVLRVNEDGSVRVFGEGEEEKEVGSERPLPRRTKSDESGDVTKLDRKLNRTLYLLVKNDKGRWVLPNGPLVGKEALHQAAERILVQSAGSNMNTWTVGRVPIGHHVIKPRYSKPEEGSKSNKEFVPTMTGQGEKTFFLKGRIMAGQVDLKKNEFGITEFKWLSKDEIEPVVGPQYYSWIKGMLADR